MYKCMVGALKHICGTAASSERCGGAKIKIIKMKEKL
jgi:hypothetical protein